MYNRPPASWMCPLEWKCILFLFFFFLMYCCIFHEEEEEPVWWLDQKLLLRNLGRCCSPKPSRRSKQPASSPRELCSSWLFWASLCSSRLVSQNWPQRCLESLMRGGRGGWGGTQSAGSLWLPAIGLPAWHIAAHEFAETVLQRELKLLPLSPSLSSLSELHWSLEFLRMGSYKDN